MVPLKVQVPESWRDRLRELADERAISVADLVRIFLREALYDRLPERRQ
jgi:hypothetical protein